MVINRFLETERFSRAQKDLPPLVDLINKSYGEYSLQLRENYFNIYYQGNSLAKVIFNANDTYSAEIHERFVTEKIHAKLCQYAEKNSRQSSKYECYKIYKGKFHQFFQSSHLRSIASAIRDVGNGEEITFEQILITDNPPSKTFIIIDRQIADHESKAQMDLLAIVRDSEDKPFHFLIIELKLGRNPELADKVASQLSDYMEHLQSHKNDYINCYKNNYHQKKQLGLFPQDTPDEIEIDGSKVEGLIVVGGYSQLAEQALPSLCKLISDKRWDIRVQQMKNEIKYSNASICDSYSGKQ